MRRDYYEPENSTNEDRPDHTAPSGQVAAGSATQMMKDKASDVQEQAGQVAEKAQEQAGAMKDKAMEQAEVGKQKAASGLHSAAEQMRSRSGDGEGTKGQVMTKAADTMERSATYLEEHEPREIWEDFEQYVKDHPMQAAAGALFAGFLAGRMLR